MSGIVGFLGNRSAVPILLDCLDTLDYRGYDSAGIAISNQQHVEIRKTVGRVKDLRAHLLREPVMHGTIGIGHTRWATHGKPSEANSHPLTGCDRRFVVVHNGIIENYPQVRRSLMAQGHTFKTETDTEVIPHLLEEYDTGDLEETVRKVLPMLKGSFALAIMSEAQPDTIIAVSQDNPLVLGVGRKEAFLASDIPALLPYTREIYPIKNGEIAILTPGKATVKRLDGTEVTPHYSLADETVYDVLLHDYKHYMMKEIFDQPKALEDMLTGRLTPEGVDLPELAQIWTVEKLKNLRKVDIVASGTSNHAGVIGKKALEQLLDLPVEVSYSSEFIHEHGTLDERNLVILLSQSGETADTLSALREAKKHGCSTLAITNTAGSTLSRKADCTLLTKAGPEFAVASTKAYTSQITALILLAIWMAQRMGSARKEEVSELLQALERLPGDVDSTLIMTHDAIDQFAQLTYDQEHLFLIGRGLDYVLALEGALKLQEVAYIHADAYAAGEMKHGTMALITPGVPVIALATQARVFDKTVSNIKEVKARDAFVVGITTVGDDVLADEVDEVMYIPSTHSLLLPILAAIPLQLLAYYAGTVRGHDVDRPRNLAKSLTVE
ncbi:MULTISPECIES: glutamine--fructose-6-phosphate transaminase (isomerizing) [Aneurinibacillus]|uniref:Glutamine--fructose-6-phosphate aminotransferase [isomerizing] n=1 Tax=Aneurinibacillus thermoaerophilus TaxID=143495 RepID=A0A1G8EZX2_ANETH|nr:MULTISPECIES: glutamine--fructose-6-phosphate transaminase (isomerizing) [Aneurinibacillus]AMA73418.1 glutamine--fructose-6-phosphate aminotransferase [Aneurinibacillus sp. XH2]MED0680602.1 glutamine--fructose-6-phosphate transaminase (isomerizing) [Aneurinibacillus thermoaerophilus]MED0738930.1 glutamine--fructose-6-phosphate transaminase (isomerizing) [Aneurinibacillus thermoaerophilus]MED0758588.1 glutamine--fructose-6-phosphate transaminase (isomerizing) [Aneurinibacillus thermoaerophilu